MAEPDATPAAVQVGDLLPTLVRGPITRRTLALFAGASGDHNPIHIDLDFARAAGRDDVFAHGMLSMAYLAQMLTGWAGAHGLRTWNVRFVAVTPLHATVACMGEIVEVSEVEGERRARVAIECRTDTGLQTLVGEAVVALGPLG
jgi:acyl dehydratase